MVARDPFFQGDWDEQGEAWGEAAPSERPGVVKAKLRARAAGPDAILQPLTFAPKHIAGRTLSWTLNERVVLRSILDRAQNETGRTHAGKLALTLAELADRTGLSRSAVIRALNDLERVGALTRYTSRKSDGQNAPTVYQLHPLAIVRVGRTPRSEWGGGSAPETLGGCLPDTQGSVQETPDLDPDRLPTVAEAAASLATTVEEVLDASTDRRRRHGRVEPR